jgi:hypothetical protein
LGEAVVPGCDVSEVFEPVEHAFDGIAVAIDVRREAIRPASICLWWDVGCDPSALDLSAHRVAVIALVGIQDRGVWRQFQQSVCGDAVGHLSTCQQEGERPTKAIGQGMDFRGSTATRAANGLLLFPPFPPEAQRCAFTAEESISTCAGGPPTAANAWNISDHTPLAAHRTKRL